MEKFTLSKASTDAEKMTLELDLSAARTIEPIIANKTGSENTE
jgi:hypothetical protein